jgi:prefoldin subunit 5|tara:strand:- start:82 stop:339 length:258 start_codon:yes stop_codon:yes gene_type:complete
MTSSTNYNQILDGIQDQIDDLNAAKFNYEQQIALLNSELSKIPQQIADLEALRDKTQSISSNSVDLNINLNVTGATIRSSSTSVG